MAPTQFVRSVYRQMKGHNAFDGAAVLAFYLTLAIFPATIALLAVTPYLPIARVDQALMDLMHEALPTSADDMFAGVVQQVTGERRGGLLTLGVAAAYWSASNGMYAIMRQLNVALDVKERRPFLRARGTALLDHDLVALAADDAARFHVGDEGRITVIGSEHAPCDLAR